MISHIETMNYRCLRYINVDLEPFHILIGPNASGKSTFLDVMAFLEDTVNDGPEQAVLKRAQSLQELVWKRSEHDIQIIIEMSIPQTIQTRFNQNDKKYTYCRYEIKVGVDSIKGGIRLLAENFFLKSDTGIQKRPKQTDLFPESHNPPDNIIIEKYKRTPSGWRKVISLTDEGRAYFHSEITNWNFPLRPGSQKTALAVVPEEERFPVSTWVKSVLSEGVHVLSLNSRSMREPCRPDAPLSFRIDGSNLPVVIRNLSKADPRRFIQWLDHVKTVLPDIKDIGVSEREVDMFPYLTITYINGITVPSWLLSDGTLRLLALTLLAYIPDKGNIYLIEEPENGIHPKALESIYQSLSSVYDSQVLCATHSPLFLGLSEPSHLLCFALTENGETDIIKGSDHPALKAWKNQVSLETLYAAGVLG